MPEHHQFRVVEPATAEGVAERIGEIQAETEDPALPGVLKLLLTSPVDQDIPRVPPTPYTFDVARDKIVSDGDTIVTVHAEMPTNPTVQTVIIDLPLDRQQPATVDILTREAIEAD